jgi:hypothetical protein
MTETFRISAAKQKDGKLVQFGPLDPETGWTMMIPEHLTRIVFYPQMKLEITLDCVFTGERLEITLMTIEGRGGFVSTRDLTQLALPSVMREIVVGAVPDAHRWSNPASADNLNRPEGYGYLAQMYWFEYAGWGTPRANIMTYMDWSRANANFHIKKINRNFSLPRAHSEAASRALKTGNSKQVPQN